MTATTTGVAGANSNDDCPVCGAKGNEQLRNCATCLADLGFPNVRHAACATEARALHQRYDDGRKAAVKAGAGSEFDAMVDAISVSSVVVVSMPFLEARGFLGDRRKIYTNYESLVAANAREPAPKQSDADRASIGGMFFGSYADEIRYGLLSLNGKGLPSYGDVFLKLRSVTVERRVSFTEENTYLLADSLGLKVRQPVPPGYRSDWNGRHQLAGAKLGSFVTPGSTLVDWAQLLVRAGKTRKDDSCIEAHIYGGFNKEAVDDVDFARVPKTGRERLDADAIAELMNT